ncbi:alpha/beta hydrolase [Deefgea tanakiae]|uniref:Alpha/beta hydrolase n=1 Tax=Deefgea tanakiae TaxID=2865840 RepID=A0ABX8Z771_9NEIS|nr:alpha/beta hydrolase [Deefgea tanakiae]QZA78418.1 alpha/beta hydrolase [Deefgea tanakiae]
MKIKLSNKLWLACAVVGLLLLGLLLLAERHEVKAQQQIELSFKHDQNQLVGTLLLPAGQGPFPVVLLVHGDGPQTRGGDRYTQIINAYLSAGIACFTWDKPGTGDSSGDWLQQSMQHRAQETHVAMQMLAQRSDIQAQRIGLLGFSQAGWVLPQVATMNPAPAFLITVGAALEWRAQGEFFTWQRLIRAGLSAPEIDKAIQWQRAAPQPSISLSFAEYSQQFQKYLAAFPAPNGANTAPLSAKRYHFIALNIEANSSQQLAALQIPLLAIWGQDDLNVDAKANAQTFAALLNVKNNSKHQAVVVPQADHTMLNSSVFSMQLSSEWTWWMTVRYFIAADGAFAPAFLPLIVDWAKKHSA